MAGLRKNSPLVYNFLRDPIAIGSFIVLIACVTAAFLAPVIAPTNPYDTRQIDIMDAELPPVFAQDHDPRFLLGTDDQGRDMFSTILYGLRVSIIIGIGAVVVQGILGVIIGLIAGYKGGWLESFLMRTADVQLSFSTYMVAIFLGAIFQAVVGIGTYNEIAIPFLIIVIGLAEWPKYARTVRASVLAEKKKEYVEAARVIGLPSWRTMLFHILPNTMTPVLVISTVQVANAIMSEAALSFIGLGMPVTKPSLGSLIKAGFDYISSGSWWITLFPGIVLVILILAINLLGDWMRDYLNPKIYKD